MSGAPVVHASEGLTHWYDRQGKPCYTVIGANGKERPTTLRDARKLGLCPSVTTIIKCADRPGLTNWMIDQGILAALTLPRIQDEPEAAYLARIKQDSREQARKAAERGTAIHADIQGHYEGEAPSEEYWPHVQGAVKAVKEWADVEWKPEESFACRIGFGGKVDLSSYEIDCGHVLDFKSKEFGPEDDLRTWDEHAYQLAAYREGLGYPDARCAIGYVSVTHPGLTRIIEIDHDELKKGWKCFYSLLQFYKAKTGYESSFEEALAA